MNQLQTREQNARDLVGLKMSQIQTILGGDKAKASIFASAIVNIANDKDLRGCNVESIVNTAMQIVQIGLHPNKLFGQAYVVPYGGVAQLQIGYKGLISLGYRNGWKFRAIAVYSCDKFEINFAGIKDEINFTPSYDERDETDGEWVFDNLRGVLVFAVDKQGAEFSEFVSKKKLEKLRLKSQNQKSQDKLAHIWLEWAEEMYKAKAIKYVASRLPINDSLAEALSLEDEPIRAEQSKPQTPKTQNLNELLNSSEKPNSSTVKQNLTVDEAEYIEAAPVEVEIDVNEDVLPLDALQSELMNRGVSEAEAEKLLERVSPDEAKAYLADPNSIDALMEDLRG
ncbi:recombinase RecT [uncultured Campylobacter sp.]|uniref:recombinase RecT n=1 Tax=uncultured Campylobacter sp. TaxID=218934 RepID=UPI0026287F52|nr:recombinase RecT [uncultured Campylobacter sp.]